MALIPSCSAPALPFFLPQCQRLSCSYCLTTRFGCKLNENDAHLTLFQPYTFHKLHTHSCEVFSCRKDQMQPSLAAIVIAGTAGGSADMAIEYGVVLPALRIYG
jgi:hypothetical protein